MKKNQLIPVVFAGLVLAVGLLAHPDPETPKNQKDPKIPSLGLKPKNLGAVIPHQHLKYKTVTADYVVHEENGYATVRWEAAYNPPPTPLPPPAPLPADNRFDTLIYTVTITLYDGDPAKGGTIKPRAATYSLLSLGVQAIGHDNQIRSATAYKEDGTTVVQDGVKFAAAGETAANRVAEQFVLRTGVVARDPKNPGVESVDADRIWFVSLSATTAKCVLKVEAANRKRIGFTGWDDGNYSEGHDNQPPENPPQ